MDMENGDKVSQLGYLCPQDSRGGDNPNNPPYIPTNNEISEMILHFDNLLFLTKILCSSKCFSFLKDNLLLFKSCKTHGIL